MILLVISLLGMVQVVVVVLPGLVVLQRLIGSGDQSEPVLRLLPQFLEILGFVPFFWNSWKLEFYDLKFLPFNTKNFST